MKAEYLEQSSVEAQLPVSAAVPVARGRRVSAPLPVCWREFRIQILPIIAFGSSLLLALAVWIKAVVPIPAVQAIDTPASSGEVRVATPSAPDPVIQSIPDPGTNGIAKAPPLRD